MALETEMKLAMFLCFMFYCFAGLGRVFAATNPNDASALNSLVQQWQNLPPSWGKSEDPCGLPWEGVQCSNSRVTALSLSSMNIKGSLGGDIGQLPELRSLVLSFNKGLTGSISPGIGNLKKLETLILAGCGFTGSIPDEIGKLVKLTYLALNSNNFSGTIPASLGNLSQVYWLDLADNQLEGSLPISTETTPGLDQLLHAKHFHFNKNRLTGGIPAKLFSSGMVLLHVLFDGNKLTGEIPATLGLVKSLEVLRLDGNSLSGLVPNNLNNLSLYELHLGNNKLRGPYPNLTGLISISYVDLSNNSFTASEAPSWFSTLNTLTTLVMENANLKGPVPEALFNLPQLQQVKLKKNQVSDFSVGNEVSQQLKLVDLEDNNISEYQLSSRYKDVLLLKGNPLCVDLRYNNYCKIQEEPNVTTVSHCNSKPCPSNLRLNPRRCDCALPYEGNLYFRAPFFRDLSNATVFTTLENNLWQKLGLTDGSASIQNPFFNSDNYLQVQLLLFPSTGKYFTRMDIQRLGFELSNQTYKPPKVFGPYYFLGFSYDFQDSKGGSSVSLVMIVGIAIGVVLLIAVLILVAVFCVRRKKPRGTAAEMSTSFASWGSTGKDVGGAPQLKGARWFSYEELKKSTNNFQDSNEVGSGGYGKVYRGVLANGQLIAIKRAQHGSMQGGLEFKTEIELLSRVHHKNLVSLVGFCFEQGEQMLVYEFIANRTLRDSLSGRSGIYLDWKRRLRIILGSARGLSYLHEHANPPIIHRDIKSSNIMLDETLNAKVADFGLSKLMEDSGNGHVSTQVKGTMGYLDPEYYMTQRLTEKSDVYSFGVVMLEMVTAKQPLEKGVYVVREVRKKLNMNDHRHCGLNDLMDPSIRNEANLIGFARYIELAMKCLAEAAEDRPTMSTMVKEIEEMLQNDGLNSNIPSQTHSASTSATDIVNERDSHPYNDVLPRRQAANRDSFEYSGDFAHSSKVIPK
ncbi:hypothetical protein ACHQM5_013299 [Ranunculus cassubicifolius]